MQRILPIALAILFYTPFGFAKGPDFSIFEVRRQLPLSNDEKTEKDFYIYAGTEEGLKADGIYDVVRRVPLYDGFQNRSLGELNIKVAQVKIIFTDKNISIARYHKDFSRDSIPVLKDNYILLGDLIDPNSLSKSAENIPTRFHDSDSVAESSEKDEVRLVINSIDLTEKAYNP